MNQLAWMSQNAALNRSAVRYNRPNIWPMGSSTGSMDATAAATGIQVPPNNVSAQNNNVDMNALFNMLNSNPAAAAPQQNAAQWSQGYQTAWTTSCSTTLSANS